MKRILLAILVTVLANAVLILISGIFGHNEKMVVGFFMMTAITYYLLNKADKRGITFILILGITFFSGLFINLLYFSATGISFPSSVAIILGCFSGLLLQIKYLKFIPVVFLAFIVFMFFKGTSLWLHKINYNTYLARTDKTVNNLVFRDEAGNFYNTSEYSSDRIVLVNFWNNYCGACLREFPQLNKLDSLLKKSKISFLAINVPVRKEDYMAIANERLLSNHGKFSNYFAVNTDSLTSEFNISSYPTTIVLQGNKMLYRGSLFDCIKGIEKSFGININLK